jgi:hypothetical protein
MKSLGHLAVSAHDSLLGYLDIAGTGNLSPPFEIRRDNARKLFR